MAESDDDVTALAMGGDKTAVVPQRESWAATWGHAAILIAVGVVAAITIIAIGLRTVRRFVSKRDRMCVLVSG